MKIFYTEGGHTYAAGAWRGSLEELKGYIRDLNVRANSWRRYFYCEPGEELSTPIHQDDPQANYRLGGRTVTYGGAGQAKRRAA